MSCTANIFFNANRFATRRYFFTTGTFRFMQLPPEFHCRVCAYVFGNERNWESGLQLADLRLPGIARVSKNIRKEALPQFFVEAFSYLSIPISSSVTGIAIKQASVKIQMRTSSTQQTRVPEGQILVILHLNVQKGMLKIGVEKGEKFAEVEERDGDDGAMQYQTEDYYAAIGDVRTTIDHIGSRPKFEGFGLKDITQVAKALKY
ncbi:hypothetical protein AC579_7311 [Pseudocercospora musae]|uniref:Uncharacterized protein n=1 Tax=Pseudocercospora musae TaxID=113226 RepID=A0A139I143_9PEZI|nr:hypothetical protein AC579_7311 [Pseudocercospora musae]